jgi:hypothetical protein
MAAAVAAIFTPTQLEDYGNIIFNGTNEAVANTTNRKAWKYKETSAAPVNLPSVPQITPAMKGWTTNYMEYYTQLVNTYGVDPGDPTMFSYWVNSFASATGVISALGSLEFGQGYNTGSYSNVPLVGGSGVGATANIIVGATGRVTSVAISNPGTGYTLGDGLTAVTSIGSGYGFAIQVVSLVLPSTTPDNLPRYAQPPRRFNQQTVGATGPNPSVNYPNAIAYSFMYPVADNTTPPPIDTV